MSFLNALKKESEKIVQAREPVQTILSKKIAEHVAETSNPIVENNPLIVTIDRVINRGRLDVFFNQKPSDLILRRLKDKGFHFRPSDKAWYHKDTEENRLFCEAYLSANFAQDDQAGSAQLTTSDESGAIDNDYRNSVTLTSNTEEFESIDPTVKSYAIYKQQCENLANHLKCDVADLALIAINNLHIAIFGKFGRN